MSDTTQKEAIGCSRCKTAMNAEGIAAMMGDFLAAFPDLLITFDQFIAKDDFVVERYTASGTHQGPLGDLKPTNLRPPGPA